MISFVKYGNKVHEIFMKVQLSKSTCNIPVASDVPGLKFELSTNCALNNQCHIPAYWISNRCVSTVSTNRFFHICVEWNSLLYLIL